MVLAIPPLGAHRDLAGRARLSVQHRRERARARRGRAVDAFDHGRRDDLRCAAERAFDRLYRVDLRLGAGRARPVSQDLWLAAGLAAAPARARTADAAQPADRRGRRDRMGHAAHRHPDSGLLCRACRRRRLLRRAAGREPAAKAQDQLRADPRSGHHPPPEGARSMPPSPGRSARSASGSSPRRRGSRWRSAFRAKA